MPDWWMPLCLFVFVTHAPFFAWRYRQTGEIRFAATTLTFALLAVTYGVRLFAPDAQLAGAALWGWLQVPAWASAAVSLALLARHAVRRRAS